MKSRFISHLFENVFLAIASGVDICLFFLYTFHLHLTTFIGP